MLRQVDRPEYSMVDRSLNKELEMMCQTSYGIILRTRGTEANHENNPFTMFS